MTEALRGFLDDARSGPWRPEQPREDESPLERPAFWLINDAGDGLHIDAATAALLVNAALGNAKSAGLRAALERIRELVTPVPEEGVVHGPTEILEVAMAALFPTTAGRATQATRAGNDWSLAPSGEMAATRQHDERIERIAKRLDGYCDNCEGDIRLDDGGRPCLDSIHAAANDVRGLASTAVGRDVR